MGGPCIVYSFITKFPFVNATNCWVRSVCCLIEESLRRLFVDDCQLGGDERTHRPLAPASVYLFALLQHRPKREVALLQHALVDCLQLLEALLCVRYVAHAMRSISAPCFGRGLSFVEWPYSQSLV